MKYKSLKGIHPEFCGIKGVYIIKHGEWADPELSYKGMTVNMYKVVDTIVEEYEDETGCHNFDTQKFYEYWQRHDRSNHLKELITEVWEQLKN
jgi:hypothetical protein